MNLLPQLFLYTQDQSLVTRTSGYLKFLARVRHVNEPHELDALIQQYDPAFVLFDLRAEASKLLLPRIFKRAAGHAGHGIRPQSLESRHRGGSHGGVCRCRL